jgi:serine protease
VLAITAPAAGQAGPRGALRVHPELRRAGGPEFHSDRIIVKFKPGTPEQAIENIHRATGGRELPVTKYADFRLIRLPPGRAVEQMVDTYGRNPNVQYAEPDFIATAAMIPNDPFFSYQWHLDNGSGGIKMPRAWDRSTGSGVVVAVVDTGIAYEDYFPGKGEKYYIAPDLAQTDFVPGYDFVNNDNRPNDDEGHGTHVAGTVAQSTNNNLGVAGVAFGAALMPVKVLNSRGTGTYSAIAQGIVFAADNGARVINMSLTGPASSVALQDAVTYAYNRGSVLVGASGNDNGPIGYPAAYSEVIAVGATRYDETRSYYSNYGAQLDLVAPGGDTNIDQNGDGYVDGVLQQTFVPQGKDYGAFNYYFFQGTSMAAPHVAGLAALLMAQDPTLTPAQVKARLIATAKDLGPSGWDQHYGWGLINADSATLSSQGLSLTVSSLNLGTVIAGLNTWPGDDSKNKPAMIAADSAWNLTAIASGDFSDGGATAIDSMSVKMGPSYSQVVGIPKTGGAVEVAAGGPGGAVAPDLSTTLDIPWLDTLVGKSFSTTITYTVVPN